MGIARRILLLIPVLALVHAMTIQETAVVKSLELWRTYWKKMNESSPQWISRSEWKFPLGSTEKIPSMMRSVMNGKWAKKSCDEFLLARKPWEFSRNVNVRWSSRVPKSSRQENGDRWSPKKTEKSHRSWRRSSSCWSNQFRWSVWWNQRKVSRIKGHSG